MDQSKQGRVDAGSRIIEAAKQVIYRALLDPAAIQVWRPPRGMKARIEAFEPRAGGSYRMSLSYGDPDHTTPGKTSEHTDVVRGRFLELIPNEKIVEVVEFESDDSAFEGEMTITTTLTPVTGGVKVEIRCENVPAGIRESDHRAGIASTLENLAAFTE